MSAIVKAKQPQLTWFDRVVAFFSPAATVRRLEARLALRNYEAATPGHRTSGWNRNRGDVNALTRFAGGELRLHSRDLVRNNGWARRALRTIVNHTVRYGLIAKPIGPDAAVNTKARDAWRAWANSTKCDANGRKTFAGLQRAVVRAAAQDGEVLVRRRYRFATDDLPLPLQIQILEADQLDTAKEAEVSLAGGKIIQGVEFDKLGRPAAYWIFPEHPGSSTRVGVESQRIPAKDIAHVYDDERPGQVRGVSWFAAAILTLKNFDEWEDADLMKQKVAAAFAGFITDVNADSAALNAEDEDDETIEELEPGLLTNLPPGKDVKFSTPPSSVTDSFPTRQLRRVAAALGVTYEDMTGDYSQVNFSSARMGKLAHQEHVEGWQWDMLVPQFCDRVFAWAMEAAVLKGVLRLEQIPTAEWTTPAVPMIEPDKEVRASSARVRNGMATPDEIVREQGHDPEEFWAEYAENLKRLDSLKIVLDSDPRKTSQAGLTQERAGVSKDAPKPPNDANSD